MVMRTVRPPDPDSERFRDVTIDVSNLVGATAQLRIVDEATGAWGHLDVDEVWLVP
jgi:levanbiose-producing levanase